MCVCWYRASGKGVWIFKAAHGHTIYKYDSWVSKGDAYIHFVRIKWIRAAGLILVRQQVRADEIAGKYAMRENWNTGAEDVHSNSNKVDVGIRTISSYHMSAKCQRKTPSGAWINLKIFPLWDCAFIGLYLVLWDYLNSFWLIVKMRLHVLSFKINICLYTMHIFKFSGIMQSREKYILGSNVSCWKA